MLRLLKMLLHSTESTNGAKRIRTADFLNAIVALYQLSYSPAVTIMPRLERRVKQGLDDSTSP